MVCLSHETVGFQPGSGCLHTMCPLYSPSAGDLQVMFMKLVNPRKAK